MKKTSARENPEASIQTSLLVKTKHGKTQRYSGVQSDAFRT